MSDGPWTLVMEAVEAGLRGKKRFDWVQARYPEPLNADSIRNFASAYGKIRLVLRGAALSGSKELQGYSMLRAGHAYTDLVRELGIDPALASDMRVHFSRAIGTSPPYKPAASRAKLNAAIVWPVAEANGRHPHAPIRSRRTIAEAVMLTLAEGHQHLDDIVREVQRRLDRTVSRSVVNTIATHLRMAKLAIDGHRDNTKFNRIARELLSGAGNREVEKKLGVSYNMVATVRSRVRAVQASRLPVDPTFHLQPSQDHSTQHLPEWSRDRSTGMEPWRT